jgi:hypothetical protein
MPATCSTDITCLLRPVNAMSEIPVTLVLAVEVSVTKECVTFVDILFRVSWVRLCGSHHERNVKLL